LVTKSEKINILFTIKRQVNKIYYEIREERFVGSKEEGRLKIMLIDTMDVIDHEVQF
jgi:hypothetical protein